MRNIEAINKRIGKLHTLAEMSEITGLKEYQILCMVSMEKLSPPQLLKAYAWTDGQLNEFLVKYKTDYQEILKELEELERDPFE